MQTLKLFSSLFVFLLFASISIAQQTGVVNYESLGTSFTIPDGWVGQEQNGVFLMGSNSIPGFILVTSNEARDMETLKKNAKEGLVEPGGTNLQMAGSFETVSSKIVGAEFTGTLEHQAAKAYICGVINPYGQGATVVAVTLKDMYDSKHKSAAISIAKSFQFKKPESGPIIQEWKEKINGTKLTYMYSYYSNSGGGGGGTSDKTVIDLCPQGYFKYYRNSHTHIDVGSTATGDSRSNGSGEWKVVGNFQGQAVLQLNFYSGEVYEYTLSMDGTKTLLNGKRYFRTWTGENAPSCN